MKKYFLSYFLLLFPLFSIAQIVNIEAKRKLINTDTTGWFGSTDLGFNLNENGKTVLTLTANATIEYLNDKNRWLSLTNYRVVRAEGQDFVNQGFQHIRYNRDWTEKVTWEVFGQAQYDERLTLRFRGLLGTGPRFQLIENEKGDLFFGTLYMFQYEELTENNIIYRDHRLSNYLSYRLNLGKNLKLTGTSYYQPLLNKPKVARLSSQTTLLFKITEKLSFKSAINISLDSRLSEAVEDVPIAIYSFVNGLKWVF
jgi:hypothetical protein